MTDLLVTPVGPSLPDRTFKTRLDGRDYVLRLLWNGREGRWYLTVSDVSGAVLVSSVKVVCNTDLLGASAERPYRRWSEDLPPGELWAIDQTADGSPPGIDELGEGKRVELTYFPEGE